SASLIFIRLLAAQPPSSLKSVNLSSLTQVSPDLSSRELLRIPIMMLLTLARFGLTFIFTLLNGLSELNHWYSEVRLTEEFSTLMASLRRNLTCWNRSSGTSSLFSSGHTMCLWEIFSFT